MTNPADLAQLVRANAAHLAPAAGSLEEERALEGIDAAREDELSARDRDRSRREWRRSVVRNVRDARGG